MKTIKSVLLISAICLLAFSCKKDDEKSPADYPFSKEDVSVDKAKVEDAGQLMVTEMKAMENVEAAPVLDAFADCGDLNNPFETSSVKSAPILRTITAASAVTSGKNAISYLSEMMKADATEDPATLKEAFDKYKGIYTWNATQKVWVKAASAEFKFVFPAKKGNTANDATLSITYTEKTGVQPIEGYEGGLPATFNATIAVKEKKVFEIDFEATYNGDGLPVDVKYFVALYPYKYEISWAYSSSSITLRYQLTNGSKNILDCYGKLGGNFSLDNITTVSTSENPELTDVVTNGNAYFQVFNIKLAGDIDFKGLKAAEEKIRKDNEGLKADTIYANEINKYVSLDLVLADSKQKIASVETYPVVKTRAIWNGAGYTTEKYAKIDMRFIFGNGSKNDLETYFTTGFDTLIGDMNSFIVELNNDYKVGLSDVDYK